MRKGTVVRTLALLVAVCIPALRSPVEAVEPDEVRERLRRSARYLQSISLNGGYPESYTLEHAKKRRTGEQQDTTTDIRIHPPGTPSVGDAFLRAWRVTEEEIFLQGALDAARALVWGQNKSGGWSYSADVEGFSFDQIGNHRPAGISSFDDAMTQGPLLFLMKLDQHVDKDWLTTAIERGLSLLMEAQFENGAWPQRYPLSGGYSEYYTFNDAAMNDCIDVLLQAHRQYGGDQYRQALRKAGTFLIESRRKPPQAGWAQQYTHDMEPAWARGFEPPGICSLVTANNIRTLVELYLYTENERYLSPIPDAIKWLQRSTIGENRWARLYEVETNRPVYGDRNDPDKKHFDYDAISKEERNSYAWQGSYGIPDVIEYYREVKNTGASRYKEKNPGAPVVSLGIGGLSTGGNSPPGPGVETVRNIIQQQDEAGRWVTGGRIQTATFVDHMNTLSNYLQANSEQTK